MSEFAKKFDNYDYDNKVCATGFRDVNVCVPVTITPEVNVGNARVKRIGKAEVSDYCCGGKEETSCSFTISQKLRVEVPVDFDAKATPGKTFIDCDCDCGDCCDDNDW